VGRKEIKPSLKHEMPGFDGFAEEFGAAHL